MPSKIVFSCQADFQGIALQEILNTTESLKFIKWIDDGAGLLEYAGPFVEFSLLSKHVQNTNSKQIMNTLSKSNLLPSNSRT